MHLNIEPWPSGNRELLVFLRQLRRQLPREKLLSVAAYPPPLPVIGDHNIHWTPEYIEEIAAHSDQLAFMNYDSGQKLRKLYIALQSWWIGRILAHTAGTEVLIGLPAYEDDWAPWHDPDVENLSSALAGLHDALGQFGAPPSHYRGVSIYADWEMSPDEWETLARDYNRKASNKPPAGEARPQPRGE